VRDALARLRSDTELPQELLPDLIELARLCAHSHPALPELADPWLVGQEEFWDRFQVGAERTLPDIERELGELDRSTERMRELRETLRAYLEHSQSVSATAALRRRDRKTIGRQLRFAEQLIHHRVSERSDELLIALRVAEILQNGD
jgi:hypothetical protein